jgi:hypothetical protein
MVFYLWVYENTISLKHPNFYIRNAEEILPREKMFFYVGNGDCPKNSLGGFSDIFRYYILLKNDGIYVDMDTICFKDYSDIYKDFIIRPHYRLETVGNILRISDKKILQELIEETELNVNENNNCWVKPVKIFNNIIKKNKLQNFILDKKILGNDDPSDISIFLTNNFLISKKLLPSHGIHVCSTAFKTGNWNITMKYDFDSPYKLSEYERVKSLYL